MQAVDVNAEAARVLAAAAWGSPHDILGVDRAAPLAEVKARYKKLCALHPDKAHGNALAAEAFALISAAYRKLSEAPAAGVGAQHGSQAEPAPGFNRWQAFTGGRQPQQPAGQPQQQHVPQQQHAQQPFTSSQENTPGGGNAAGGGSAWQASAKWGKFGGGGSSLLRAQPVTAVPVAAAPAGAEPPAAAHEQRPVRAGQQARRRSPSLGGPGGSSDSGDSESGSSGSDSDGDFLRHDSGRRSAAGVKPAAFYGPAGGSGGKQTSPSLSQMPPSSLYGMFSGRRSSGGQAAGWLGVGMGAGTAQPEPRSFSQPLPVAQQPAAAEAGGSKWSSGGLTGGQWGGGGGLADMLKKAPVVAPAARAGPGLAAGTAAAAQPQHQEEQGAQPAGEAQQQPKRRPAPLSSSASSSGDEGWEESGKH